ncbi:MAG: hypothetical protein GX621_08525 [Pirellulaceae bacterium]|nr:hypothetical protein [Pirellulaceae bacterium]
MKKLWIPLVLLVAVLLLAPLVVPVFCRHEDINITTGQARYSRSLWFVALSERIEDTSLSRILQGETVDAAHVEPWRRVNTFSPGVRNSPHYRFHAALHQARLMERIETMPELSPERKKDIAREILTMWQTTEGTRQADEYIDRVLEEL